MVAFPTYFKGIPAGALNICAISENIHNTDQYILVCMFRSKEAGMSSTESLELI